MAGISGRLWWVANLLVTAVSVAYGEPRQEPKIHPGPDGRWSLAAVGDIIMNRRISIHESGEDPRFAAMVRILREAEATFGNLEQSVFRWRSFQGWPEVENGGNWEQAEPEILVDLKSMGFDLFSRANNHTTDYGVLGMKLTDDALDELGIVHAGTGATLGRASRPGYLETPSGRIALISLASSFTPMSRAGEARDDVPGRPGLNPLRITRSFEADPGTMETLREFAEHAGLPVADPFMLLGSKIVPGSSVRAVDTMNPRDVERILREVRNAADQADFVVVTIHAHQHQAAEYELTTPEWLVEIAHLCIDAGASTFIGHGPHALRGMEIYRNRPIFYSLANFVFHNETIDPMPSDHYERYDLPPTALASDLYNARFHNGTKGFPSRPEIYESVIAVPVFRGRDAVEVRLHPIDLARTAPRSQRGTPRLAEPEQGRRIIERMARMSAVLGTKITYENGTGVWRAAP